MNFYSANRDQFELVKKFYWDLIDAMQNQKELIGWEKGIYPTDEFLWNSICNQELYLLTENNLILAAVILNGESNEGYQDAPWSLAVAERDVLIPHALGVNATMRGKGVAKKMVQHIIELARNLGKKAIRLDVLGSNYVAENLYKNLGFQFVEAKQMFYEDTGWTEYRLYEMNL